MLINMEYCGDKNFGFRVISLMACFVQVGGRICIIFFKNVKLILLIFKCSMVTILKIFLSSYCTVFDERI